MIDGLFLRAVLAFLALPGIVAFLVPMVAFGRPGWAFVNGWGYTLFAAGVTLLLWCVREFYVVGRGTLAPWSPPTHLVTTGPYRVSRNPMYVAVLLILVGWAVGYRSAPHAAYAACIALAFHLRVIVYEERYLARAHGAAWTEYRSRVPRWILF